MNEMKRLAAVAWVVPMLMCAGAAMANDAPEAAVVAKPESTAEQGSDSGATGSGKFIERTGTGSSKPVRTAPPVTLPQGPLGKPPADINKLIEQASKGALSQTPKPEEVNKVIAEAQKEGGQALDPIQRDMNLPGLKKDDPALKPFVIHTRNGVNEIVKMSGRLLNRVATPFKKPLVIDSAGENSRSITKVVGSDIYYLPEGDKPIGLYIVDSSNTSQAISLTVVPAGDLPGQNIIIKLEDLRTVASLAEAASTEEGELSQPRTTDYTGTVRSLLTQAVRGKVAGFAPVPLEGGVARMGTLDVEPELAFTGAVFDIYRYRITNSGSKPIDLVETAFYRKGVKAVSFFPSFALNPGDQSYVFLLADKPESANVALNKDSR